MTTILATLALATAATLDDMPLPEVEKAYWDCDYAGRQTLIDFADAETCSRVFERLKTEKFAGDFKLFLEWWKANNAREYAERVRR